MPIANIDTSRMPVERTPEWDKLLTKQSRKWSATIQPETVTDTMVYYYRRGNRYFLRSDKARIVIETDDPEFIKKAGLERGKAVVVGFTYR